MEIRDLIVDTDKEATTIVKKKAVKAAVEYEVAIQSGCDFAIRRKTPRSSKLLVMLVSQGSFYIKDEKTEVIEKLTAENYTKFKSDMKEPITFTNVNWTKTFAKRDSRDNYNNTYILNTIKNSEFAGLAKRGLIHLSSNFCPSINKLEIVNQYPLLYKYIYENYKDKVYFDSLFNSLTERFKFRENCNKYSFMDIHEGYWYRSTDTLISYFDILGKIVDVFGLENTRRLIDLMISKMDGYSISSYIAIIYSIVRPENGVNFKFKDLYNYLEYAPVYNGFLQFRDFLSTYRDTLKTQCLLYDKIKDKYPKSLMLTHDQCVYQYHFKKILIDEKNFAKNAKEAEKFEWGNKEYKIMIPKLPEELTDEAVQQGNCLKTYIEKVTNGQCVIAFLRKKSSIEKSYISIEINGNRVVQVEGTNHRRHFTEKEYEVMEAWAKDKKLTLSFGKYTGGAV